MVILKLSFTFSQGKLHMWIDLFPYNDSIPAPIAINPREPQK